MTPLMILPLVTVFLRISGSNALPIGNSSQLGIADPYRFFSPQCEAWTIDQLRETTGESTSLTSADVYSRLPPASIIITFFNEAEDIIKRTLYLIWQRTPQKLIQEVILVDDASTIDYHFTWLADHAEKVRLIRNPSRAGLMVSRMNGARQAKAKVLVFLDSHVEVDPGWLPSLLVRLLPRKRSIRDTVDPPSSDETCSNSASSEHLIVSPAVYDIKALEETNANFVHPPTRLGGFTWNLTFRWEPDYSARDSVHARKTPAISGGLFAVWRDSFFQLGGYDEAMKIWGGENVELSLRTWMCGGQMEIIPCSRVGHLFRTEHPYTFPDSKEVTVVRNNKRAVLVWFLSQPDIVPRETEEYQPVDYLTFFYATCPLARSVVAGSLSSRRHLTNQLKCHSFTWYLNCIYPKLKQEIRNIFVNKEVRSLAELEVNSIGASYDL